MISDIIAPSSWWGSFNLSSEQCRQWRIARPLTPFNLVVDEKVRPHVSSPLWPELAAESANMVLPELAIQRPSDTSFGPSTREGELCCASATHCRLNIDELPQRPHRAITPAASPHSPQSGREGTRQ